MQSWPASQQRLATHRKAQAEDEALAMVMETCKLGWSNKKSSHIYLLGE